MVVVAMAGMMTVTVVGIVGMVVAKMVVAVTMVLKTTGGWQRLRMS